jgi:hypothetical protein
MAPAPLREPVLERVDFQLFDPLLSGAQAEAMLRLCERFGSYGTYAEEAIEDDFAEGLAQRYDAAINFVRTGGRFGRKESIAKLAARTNYFRETYAYDTPLVPGIEPFLQHEGFVEAARRVHGRALVRPNIVYANLLVPGQELAVHTDVPEFRGVSRKRDPQWLIVAMHHSRLFERWRMPIATGVAWFGEPEGGEFVFYPEGPWGAPVALTPRHNTAILLDTDTVFHGVDRVAESRVPMPDLKPGMRLIFDGDGRWSLSSGDQVLARYAFRDLRFSISWKAYCYTDEAEEALVREHCDDLSRAQVLEVLTADLRRRGRIQGETPKPTDLALAIISEYIQYPPPAPGTETGSRATG